MFATWSRPPVLSGVVLALTLWAPAGAHGQRPSQAAEAATELLEVVRTGDEARIRAFIGARFTPELRGIVPMDEHLMMFGFFRKDLEGREVAGVEEQSSTEVSVILAGTDGRLEMRVQVEPDPPYRIDGLHVGDAGPAIGARSLDELGPELERIAGLDEFSGVVLVGASGEIPFHGAYGLADREAGRPNRPDTRFDLGSINKLFTATAVLRLVQDGRLDLADPVGKYLEGFAPRVAERVTVEHLLRHRSGFGDYLSHPQFEEDPRRFRRPADFLPLAREQALAFEPGTGDRYSNMGFVLLGAILERVTGRGYHEVIDDLVFGPARMATAGPTGGGRAARRYHRMREGFVRVDSLYPDVGSPAGGGFAAAMDLYRFVDALLEHRLLNEENTALLLNGFRGGAEGAALPEQFGFAGGADGVNAILLVRPTERRSVIVLANLEPLALGAVARRILELSKRRSDSGEGGAP